MPAIEAEAGGEVKVDDEAAAAALYHLRDLIDKEDRLSIVSPPRAVQMQSASLHSFPAVVVKGQVTSRDPERVRELAEADRLSGRESATTTITTTTTIRLLLVRLEDAATDLCVVLNVPWKELLKAAGEDGGKVDEEEVFADEVLDGVVGSLDVRDFGLFGGGE